MIGVLMWETPKIIHELDEKNETFYFSRVWCLPPSYLAESKTTDETTMYSLVYRSRGKSQL